jgi:hypothetical protein
MVSIFSEYQAFCYTIMLVIILISYKAKLQVVIDNITNKTLAVRTRFGLLLLIFFIWSQLRLIKTINVGSRKRLTFIGMKLGVDLAVNNGNNMEPANPKITAVYVASDLADSSNVEGSAIAFFVYIPEK